MIVPVAEPIRSLELHAECCIRIPANSSCGACSGRPTIMMTLESASSTFNQKFGLIGFIDGIARKACLWAECK
jgi:hypothetical protein